MKKIPVLLIGCGNIGRQLLKHIVNYRSIHTEQGVILQLVGVCDRRSSILASDLGIDELNDSFLMRIHMHKGKFEGNNLRQVRSHPLSSLIGKGECTQMELKQRILDIARRLGRSTGLVVVDCTASSEAIETLIQVIELGCCVVLANKRPLTAEMEKYEKLVLHQRRIRFEAAVGAGLPIITTLKRMLSSGDCIHYLIGSLSGTLGHVISKVVGGEAFNVAVSEAKANGYTEPDLRDDFSGMDLARKALILARVLGCRINLEDIEVESLYPDRMGPDRMTYDSFLEIGLPSLNKDFEARAKAASLNGHVLRYVFTIGGSRCQVHLMEVPQDYASGRLRGNDKLLEIYSRRFGKKPMVIQGAGAGHDNAAAAVLADIVDLADQFSS